MVRRNQIAVGLLAAVLLLLAYILYRNGHVIGGAAVAPGVGQEFVPLAIENPALRLDLLEALKKFQYEGPRRNIFSAALPPPPQPAQVAAPAIPAAPVQLAPPPLVVPASFLGYVTDPSTGTRRAFFSAGDDVYVLGVGEVLLGRFRLVQLGNNTAELEEISSGRKATLTLVEDTGSP